MLWENRGMGEGGKITDALRLSLAVLEVGLDACFSNLRKRFMRIVTVNR